MDCRNELIGILVLAFLITSMLGFPCDTQCTKSFRNSTFRTQNYVAGVLPAPSLISKYLSEGKNPPKLREVPRPLATRSMLQSRNVLIILIEFSDVVASREPSYFNDFVFKNESGTLQNYFWEASYGQFKIYGKLANESWYRSSYPLSYWGSDSTEGIDDANTPIFELAREAIIKADAHVDFSGYDSDNNGVLDPEELSICIIHAGYDQAYTGNKKDIWSHFGYILGRDYGFPDLIVDGVRISKHYGDYVGAYWMVAEFDPLGVFVHEFLHDLGLPDLYDTDYSSDGIGDWGVMAGGIWLSNPPGSCPAHPCAWSKLKLGWIKPIVVDKPINDASLLHIERSPTAFKLEISQNEYFLIVNRQKTGYDRYIPGSGILIWHIDESAENNDDENHKLVDLEEAHGRVQDLDYFGGNTGDPYDAFFYPHKTEFTDFTDPNCRSYSGQPTELWVTDISVSSENMTADFLKMFPKAIFEVSPKPPYFNAPITLTFNASASFSPNGKIVNYVWDFNHDGKIELHGKVVNYTFQDIGSYLVTLNVTDEEGYSDIESLMIRIYKRDIAILDILISSNLTCIGQTISINIIITNFGNLTEESNLTICCDNEALKELKVIIEPNQNITVTLNWTINVFSAGFKHEIWAELDKLERELDLSNNMLGVTFKVACAGGKANSNYLK